MKKYLDKEKNSFGSSQECNLKEVPAEEKQDDIVNDEHENGEEFPNVDKPKYSSLVFIFILIAQGLINLADRSHVTQNLVTTEAQYIFLLIVFAK